VIVVEREFPKDEYEYGNRSYLAAGTEGGNMMVIWSFTNRGRKAKDVKVSVGGDT